MLVQNYPKLHASKVHTVIPIFLATLPFATISSDFLILTLSLIPFGMLNNFQIISNLLCLRTSVLMVMPLDV